MTKWDVDKHICPDCHKLHDESKYYPYWCKKCFAKYEAKSKAYKKAHPETPLTGEARKRNDAAMEAINKAFG